MAPTSRQWYITRLIVCMLATGVCNTLLSKYQDMQCVHDCDDPLRRKHFEQPVLQTAQMFLGEMGCWVLLGGGVLMKRYKNSKTHSEYRPVSSNDPELDEQDPAAPIDIDDVNICGSKRTFALLAIPTICDIAGTTLMNVGLLFVAASIYQMIRGSLALFVAVLSIIVFKRYPQVYQWLALFFVVSGVAVVGLVGFINSKAPLIPPVSPEALVATLAPYDYIRLLARDVHTDNSAAIKAALGIFCIAIAQIFTAVQFVAEERVIGDLDLNPLYVVGSEGIWGFTITSIVMIIGHLTYGSTETGRYGYFDAKEGLSQMFGNSAVLGSSVLIMISIGLFNFFGISLTKELSSTRRSIVDTCRTLFIWIFSVWLGWEAFSWLQVLGFVSLVYGTFVYNNVVRFPFQSYLEKPTYDDVEGSEERITVSSV